MKTKPLPTPLADVVGMAEEEAEKVISALEEFSDKVNKSRFQKKWIIKAVATALKVNIKTLTILIDAVENDKLRREVFKPGRLSPK